MNVEQLQECFRGSRTLNQMKADITLFRCMFIDPFFGKILERFRKREREEIILRTEIKNETKNLFVGLYVASYPTCVGPTGFSGFKIRVAVFNTEYVLFVCEFTGEKMSAKMVRPVWLALPQILDELVNLFPEIQTRVDFYSNAAN